MATHRRSPLTQSTISLMSLAKTGIRQGLAIAITIAANSVQFRRTDSARDSVGFTTHLSGRGGIRGTHRRRHHHNRSRRNQHCPRAHPSHSEPLHSSRRRHLRPGHLCSHGRQPGRHPSWNAGSRKSRQARPQRRARRTLPAVHVDLLSRRIRSSHRRSHNFGER